MLRAKELKNPPRSSNWAPPEQMQPHNKSLLVGFLKRETIGTGHTVWWYSIFENNIMHCNCLDIILQFTSYLRTYSSWNVFKDMALSDKHVAWLKTKGTLLQTNSALENRPSNKTVAFQQSIFTGYVSFGECNNLLNSLKFNYTLHIPNRLPRKIRLSPKATATCVDGNGVGFEASRVFGKRSTLANSRLEIMAWNRNSKFTSWNPEIAPTIAPCIASPFIHIIYISLYSLRLMWVTNQVSTP